MEIGQAVFALDLLHSKPDFPVRLSFVLQQPISSQSAGQVTKVAMTGTTLSLGPCIVTDGRNGGLHRYLPAGGLPETPRTLGL